MVAKEANHQCAYIGLNNMQTSRMDKAQLPKVQHSDMPETLLRTLSALRLLSAILRMSFWASVWRSFAHALFPRLPTDVTAIIAAPQVLFVSSKAAVRYEHVTLVFQSHRQSNKRH